MKNKIDNFTLEYLINPLIVDRLYLNNSDNLKEFDNDKNFYKNRIISLTKKLIKSKHENENINNIFNLYIKNLIEYFKDIDTKDLLEKINDNKILDEDKDNMNLKDLNNLNNLNDLNKLIIKNEKKSDIKKFVNSDKKKNKYILPDKKIIDLKDPTLKNKGIKKHNNIIYNEN